MTAATALHRAAEAAAATWLVAGALIALVLAVAPVGDAVASVPWLVGPALWIATTLGAGVLLRRALGRRLGAGAQAAAIVAGALADALVVAAGHPWPGLATGIAVYSLVIATTSATEPREEGTP